MVQDREVERMIELVDEAEKVESASDSRYSHAVQVLTPIELLQQVDNLVEGNSRLTRPIVFRRALRLYLKMLERTGKLDIKPRSRRRNT